MKEENFQHAYKIKQQIMYLEQEMRALEDARNDFQRYGSEEFAIRLAKKLIEKAGGGVALCKITKVVLEKYKSEIAELEKEFEEL